MGAEMEVLKVSKWPWATYVESNRYLNAECVTPKTKFLTVIRQCLLNKEGLGESRPGSGKVWNAYLV